MNVHDFLREATLRLASVGIETARLDCLILLEDMLKADRALILAHQENQLPDSQLTRLNNYITQRATHIPLAYIRGTAVFYGREFEVNKHVLVPRPETEAMIEILKQLPLPAHSRIADIGTGSGCIGITAALELPATTVDLYDVDSDALAVTKSNVRLHSLQIEARQSDLLDKILAPYDVLLANLPYVPDDYTVNKAAGHEPSLALFSGQDGLDLYRRFWTQLAALQPKPSHVLIEALPQQHKTLTELATTSGFRLVRNQGFVQHFATN